MALLGIKEQDLEEQFVQGEGPGGQKINKTASCVVLSHKPSGTSIKFQKSRSRELNRYHAREQLCIKFETQNLVKKLHQKAEQARERQRNRTPTVAEKHRMIQEKRHTTEKKASRRKPKIED